MTATRYTASKRREVAAAKAAAAEAADRAAAAGTLEEFLAQAATYDLSATIAPAEFVEFQTARYTALVARFAA